MAARMPRFDRFARRLEIGRGWHIFVDELTRFAAAVADPRLTTIADRVAAPLRVAVRGRRGVGRRTVARALAGAGVTVAPDADRPELIVQVVAEVLKPEDTAAIGPLPVLVVLNKVDLLGSAAPGGLAAHTARLAKLARVPVEPMVGLLAVAALDDVLDDTLWAGLQALAAEPGDPSRVAAVPAGVGQRLVAALDLPGINRAVAAVRRGRSAVQVRALLRHASGVDVVVERIGALAAVVHYRRLLDATAELAALAAAGGPIAAPVAGFLADDDTVIARMAAAEAVIGTPPPDAGVNPDTHLDRAVTWRRAAPLSAGTCGTDLARDLVRGSLRRWHLAGGRP